MSNIIKCKNCGAEAVEGQAFCGECGAKIESLEDTIGPFGKKTEIEKVEKKKDINFNKFIKKYWKIGAIVIAILVIALGGFTLINNFSGNEDGCTVIELYADENCEDNELKEISKVIKDRAKIIDGGATVKVDDGKIILTIDDKALGLDPTERKQNLNWIKTKGDVFIYSQVDYSYSDFGKEAFEVISVEQKNKSELHNYKKYFSENEYDIIMSKDSEDINFIKIKLDDSSKVYYQQMLKNVDDNFKKYEETYQSTFDRTSLQLGIDKKEYEYAKVVGVVIPYGDKSNGEFYIVTPAAHNKNTIKLIDKVLKEENVLSTGFTEKVASTPKWETETTSFGENQVATLDGKNIILKFTPNDYNVDSYSQNDINEYMSLVKKRLDTLGSPYMVGYTGVDYKTILIKIPPSRLIANTCSMLMQGKSIVLNNQYKQLDTGVKALTIEGTDRIIVQMDGDKNRVASEYNKTSLDLLGESLDDINASLDAINGEVTETNEEEASPQQETGMLYLLVNDVTIAQADLSEMTEDGTVEFSKFLCFENGYCRAEESYVFDLIRQINSETEDDKNLILQGSLEVLHYNGDTEIKDEKIDWLFDSLNDYDRQTIRTIEKLGYNVEKSLTSRSRLMIDIDVDVNDDMPQKLADAVKEIYTACNFDDGSYSWIFFKIKNEYDKHPDDRCRFVAHKAEMGRLAVTFSAVVDGPTFEKYVPDFEKIVEQDDFYSSRFDN